MARRSRTLAVLAVAVLVTGAAVAAGTLLRSPAPGPAPEPGAARPTPARLSAIDTATLDVRRAEWCARVPAAAVRAALGQAPSGSSSWANGDPLGSTGDVAHEFGCSWTAPSGAAASGWVFAPPVTPERAQELVASARARPGCAPLPGAAAFGAPAVALTCAAGGVSTLSYRGLFGDAWLVCELSGPPDPAADPAGLADRADRWCASVLGAAD